jgi:predicted peptidase
MIRAHRRATLLSLGLALAACSRGAKPDRAQAGFQASSRQSERRLGTTGAALGFLEYLPPGYGDGSRRPLLVFLHGSRENGNGGTELGKVLASGPPRLIHDDRWPAQRPFIVLSPQHPGDGCPDAAEIHAFISFALAAYAVDESRVYLTGLSCGAIGAWRYLAQLRGAQVAAAALVCGDGRGAFESAGCALGDVAIWAFHGDRDKKVPPTGTTIPIANLMACPSPPRKEVKMTIYPGVAHDVWTPTYDGSAGNDVYGWLLGSRR